MSHINYGSNYEYTKMMKENQHPLFFLRFTLNGQILKRWAN